MHPLAHYPDDAFPLVHGFGYGDRILIELPHRGNGLRLQCLACDRTVFMGGRDLIHRCPGWLGRSVGSWATALRCQSCGSRRITVAAESDPSAAGFFVSTMETGPTVWARRLGTWLLEIGEDIRNYRPLLEALPSDEDLTGMGLTPTAAPASPAQPA